VACALLLLVGTASAAGAQTQASSVALERPAGVAFDAAGNLYIAETNNQEIRRVDTTGVLTTVAGTGVQGFGGDGGAAVAALLDSPSGVAFDAAGNLYIADAHNQRIRKITAVTGVITTIAGTGEAGFAGDGGAATAAELCLPTAVAVDGAGDVFVSDTGNHRVREIVATGAQAGTIVTVAGSGVQGFSGDGGPATAAAIDSPDGLAVGATGLLYLADTHNQRIRAVNLATGTIATVVGSGVVGSAGDGAAAAAAALALPRGVTVDAAGNLYFADMGNHRVRRVDAGTGVISTVAGNGVQGFAGDGGTATTSSLDSPRAATLTPAGLVTLGDTANQRVRQVGGGGVVETVAGLGASATAETLTLAAPAVLGYGSGSVAATLRGGSGSGTGSVVFLDVSGTSPVPVGTVMLGNNVAVLATGGLAAGMHSLMATYAGDATHAAVESAVLGVQITPAAVVASPVAVSAPYGAAIPVLTGTVTGLLAQDAGQVGVAFSSAAAVGSAVGSYAIAAALTGGAAGNYTLSLAPGNGLVTITQAATTAVLQGTASGLAVGAQATLTAQVASSTSGVPRGTVALLDGGALVQSATLSAAGAGVFNVSFPVAGTQELTAVYLGSTNFLPAASPVMEATVVGAAAAAGAGTDFSLSAAGTVAAGTMATFAFTVAEQGAGLASQVSLNVAGLPTGAVGSFSPTYIPPGVLNSAVTLTIQTPSAALHGQPGPGWGGSAPAVLTGLCVPWLAWWRRRSRGAWRWLAVLCVGVLTLGLSGCGDRVTPYSAGTGTESQSYSVTVTATGTSSSGAALTHSALVTLVVQ
jgi:sugar lactone lactonase YvrE